MKIRVGAATDVGLVREHNEDGYLAASPVFAVADGMGGHRGGEVASRVALETMDDSRREDQVVLAESVREANRAVLDRAAGEQELSGMGTTLTALLTKGDGVDLAHVGDSRAYLLRDGELQQLTEDHTLVHRMVQEGKITENEARIHPHRSILTRALGVEPDVEVDRVTLDVHPGDRILLCSDGLTSMVNDDAIGDILRRHDGPQEAAVELVEAANEAGGQDNITALILDFVEGEGVELLAPTVEPDRPKRPREPRRRPGWGRLALWLGVAIAVLGLGLVGTRVYVDRQWFVGVADDHVALYRGIPADVLGYELYDLVEETDLPAAEAIRLAPWSGLREGITASTQEEARDILEQIARDLQEERSARR